MGWGFEERGVGLGWGLLTARSGHRWRASTSLKFGIRLARVRSVLQRIRVADLPNSSDKRTRIGQLPRRTTK